MKTIQNCSAITNSKESGLIHVNQTIRFVALSATIANIEDVAEWIGDRHHLKYFKYDKKF